MPKRNQITKKRTFVLRYCFTLIFFFTCKHRKQKQCISTYLKAVKWIDGRWIQIMYKVSCTRCRSQDVILKTYRYTVLYSYVAQHSFFCFFFFYLSLVSGVSFSFSFLSAFLFSDQPNCKTMITHSYRHEYWICGLVYGYIN